MAYTLVGTDADNSGLSGASTSVNVVIPATAQAGDIAICFSASNNSAAPGSDPTGFTIIGTNHVVGTVLSTTAWQKTLVGGDAGSTLSVPCSSGRAAAGIIVYREAERDLDPVLAQVTTNATNQDIASITATGGSALVFAIAGMNVQNGVTGCTQPTGWTEREDTFTTNASGNKIGVAIFTRDAEVSSGAASGSTTFALVGALGRSNVLTFAIKQGSAPPPSAVPGWQIGSISMG